MKTFMDRAVADEMHDILLVNEFHRAVDEWHAANTAADLMTWLGMTRDEYARVVGRDGDLLGVIRDRKAQR